LYRLEHNSCHIWTEMQVAEYATVMKYFEREGLTVFQAAESGGIVPTKRTTAPKGGQAMQGKLG